MAAISEKPRTTPPIPNYRQQVRRALPDHLFKPETTSLLWFVVHFAIFGAGLWALSQHFSYATAPFIALVMGHSMGCLGFLAHDICHGASVRNRVLRDFLAAVGFSPFWIGPYLWRRWHNTEHHNNTQIEGVDPDHLFTMEGYERMPVLRFLYRLSPLLRNLIIFSSFTYRMNQQTVRMWLIYLKSPKTTGRERAILVAQMLIPMAVWVGGTLALGSQVFLWGYLIPILLGNALVISYIATNHFLNPLADESDVLATSLSVTLPRGFRWLDPWHSYFGAHVAHHLFPNAPAKSGRIIDAKVRELFPDRYHEMPITTALKLLWQTPWVYEDKETLIDPQRGVRAKTLGHGLKKDS